MRVIHVLRKPLSEGTVAANVVKHGCGGLNIDASRVAAPGETISNHSRGDESAISKGIYGDSAGQETHQTEGQKSGRWPANVILQHLDGCRCEGVKKVTTGTAVQRHGGGQVLFAGLEAGHKNTIGARADQGFAGEDGKESVANWICEPGCPVAALDEQTGVLQSGHRPNRVIGQKTKQGPTHFGQINALGVTHKDKGGASRFFKQIGGGQDV